MLQVESFLQTLCEDTEIAEVDLKVCANLSVHSSAFSRPVCVCQIGQTPGFQWRSCNTLHEHPCTPVQMGSFSMKVRRSISGGVGGSASNGTMPPSPPASPTATQSLDMVLAASNSSDVYGPRAAATSVTQCQNLCLQPSRRLKIQVCHTPLIPQAQFQPLSPTATQSTTSLDEEDESENLVNVESPKASCPACCLACCPAPRSSAQTPTRLHFTCHGARVHCARGLCFQMNSKS